MDKAFYWSKVHSVDQHSGTALTEAATLSRAIETAGGRPLQVKGILERYVRHLAVDGEYERLAALWIAAVHAHQVPLKRYIEWAVAAVKPADWRRNAKKPEPFRPLADALAKAGL